VKGKRLAQLVKTNVENAFERKMETPKANAYLFWLNEQMPYSQEKSIQADIAGDILTMVYLKKIREEASAAYTCGARASFGHADDGYHVAQLMAACPMKPEKKDVALKIMNDEVTAMAQNVDADMLAKVKANLVKNIDTAQKTNSYWSSVVYNWRTFGIDTHTHYKQLVEAQTPESIKAYMQEFLKGANKVSIIMMPKN
jgi:zinc protease